ncbi:MAG: 2-oxoglutarate oxidoreductase [Clostridiales bacterium]|jgi:pyruvate/2-oxoacid:ferredoxin oxidoreductase beta subunit|nr:2-oxoglutarate oxidoreductase [Clostridiales bacterium]
MVAKKAPELFYDESRFCGGCGHGIFNRILAEVLEEMGIVSDTIICSDIGCNHQFQFWMNVDAIVPPHGKMGAALTAMKRVRPDKTILTIAGDGGAYAIGLGETTSVALRNENVTMFVMNNTVFGMTGGQLAPTTMIGQKTASTVDGRNFADNGENTDVFKLMGSMDIAYLARTSVTSPANIMKTKKAVRKALEKQRDGKGFSLVEVLVPCPTNWHMTPAKSMEYIDEVIAKTYQLGEVIDR